MMKKAQWIQHTHVFKDDDYECSVCGYLSEEPYSICPGCGNRMAGSQYDPAWIDEMEEIDMILED